MHADHGQRVQHQGVREEDLGDGGLRSELEDKTAGLTSEFGERRAVGAGHRGLDEDHVRGPGGENWKPNSDFLQGDTLAGTSRGLRQDEVQQEQRRDHPVLQAERLAVPGVAVPHGREGDVEHREGEQEVAAGLEERHLAWKVGVERRALHQHQRGHRVREVGAQTSQGGVHQGGHLGAEGHPMEPSG